ncbi:hypothetical protein [Streptomyces sp. NPDC046805]|uniref:hypothetical protein n=1 Tax=Streptomyces sp. NPDC046805 TaxID=3155134 RepID=UPI00340E39AE
MPITIAARTPAMPDGLGERRTAVDDVAEAADKEKTGYDQEQCDERNEYDGDGHESPLGVGHAAGPRAGGQQSGDVLQPMRLGETTPAGRCHQLRDGSREVLD